MGREGKERKREIINTVKGGGGEVYLLREKELTLYTNSKR
jgi:hypothetical protein